MRLGQVNLANTVALVTQPRELEPVMPITRHGLFVIIHVILARLFRVCVDNKLQKVEPATLERELYQLQYGLHNWLRCWSMQNQEVNSQGDNPPGFLEDSAYIAADLDLRSC